VADDELETLWEDGEFLVTRTGGLDRSSRLIVTTSLEHAAPASIAKLENAFELREVLDAEWAARPVEFSQNQGRPELVVEDPGGVFLSQAIREPLGIADFLRLAIGIASALGGLHARGLVHKDVKPANILIDVATGKCWLTGFGLTSRLPRQRQSPVPPEIIAGTLAYMAPEQMGRMNRSVDSRSDLYSFGVVLYEMAIGNLPFVADMPMEWVHCHTARQPLSPSERSEGIPPMISAIIMKLLAKTAEERYQTAAGVESDLRHCLSEWEAAGHIGDFALGERDNPDRLLIPEKLYGRDREVGTLVSAFDRVVDGGRVELILVSGYSGIGKSAVVNELHRTMIPPRGLFASGKFDQYKRDIPYATLAQAFQSLVRPLLNKNDEELEKWRDALREALEPNGALIVELVPELLHIIGQQPPVPELPARDSQARFHLALRRFIDVFARPEHPLVLFLDDLQWLDAATLDLLEDLLARMDLQHLLLIGAYRDNEVDSSHPLMRKLAGMRQAGSVLHEIVLAPLGLKDLNQLLADALRCEPKHGIPLAQLVREKTSGNPFFAIQFIVTLAEEELLTFDYEVARWSWNLEQIHAKAFTDNVVDLMVEKLNRLPAETQSALQQFSCLGNSVEFTVLQRVYPGGEGKIHEDLWEAVRAGLVFRAETSYRFLHDRVQEAAYSLIPRGQRAQEHLRIGRLLARDMPSEQRDEGIFEIVNQLNFGLHLVTSAGEREWVAELNLIAAERAKLATAYISTLKYLSAARSLMSETDWDLNYDLIFSIDCLAAECELLTAEMAEAEKRLTMLSQRARNRHDFAVVTRLRLTLYTTLDRSEMAIDIALEYLRREGTIWARHPTEEEVIFEYNRIWSLLGDRQIEDLVDLPRLTDPDVIDMLDVFTEIVHPAMFYDENLSTLVVCRMVNLSLEHGNCDGSSFGYVWLAMFAGPRFNNYQQAFRFGQLGYDLVETRGFDRYRARTYLSFATLTPWARHAAKGRELVRKAYDVAYRMGDVTFTTYSWHALITNYLAVGDSLKLVQEEAETGLAFATKAGFGLVVANCETQLGLIRTLRGLTPAFGCFDDEDYSEAKAESHYASNPALMLSECFYWTRKLQARFFSGDYTAAIACAEKAQQFLWTAASQVETGDFRFYAALAYAAAWNLAVADEKQRHYDDLRQHGRQLEIWAEHCPENFENRCALVRAEIARIDGRVLDAEHLYERAIASSQEHSFIHNEAIANELAASFYRGRGFKTAADAYFLRARACYEQWGAVGKVDQLDATQPNLHLPNFPATSIATIKTTAAQLDAETVAKASQMLSSEINLPDLIEKLLRLAVEHAGAQRGLLVLLREDEPFIEAEAKSGLGTVEINLERKRVHPTHLPNSTLHYVLRTGEQVLLDDASSQSGEHEDEYVRHTGAKSILCLPILKQSNVVGALYLENNLTARAFTRSRVAVLEVLASQAAISLENARLYAELERENLERKQAEEELRSSEHNLRTIVNSIPGLVCTMSPAGEVQELNQQLLEYFGKTPETLRGWAMTDAVHPDDLPMVVREFTYSITTGTPYDVEHRCRRADGVYRWFQIRARPVKDSGDRTTGWYVLLTDIEERKKAEEALRASEHRLDQIINTIPTMVWSARPDGSCDFFNRRWLDYTGLTSEQALGWGWTSAFHPDDLQEDVLAYWQSCLTTGTPVNTELRMRRHDGVYRMFLLLAYPLWDEAGRIRGWYGTNIDIEDRKLAEEQLRRSEAFLAEGQKVSLTGSFSWNLDQELITFSAECCRIFGFSPDEPVTMEQIGTRLHPDDLPLLALKAGEARTLRNDHDYEIRLKMPDGAIKYLHSISHPVLNREGDLEYVGTIQDVTARHLADEQVRKSELHLRQMTETIPEMLWSATAEGAIDYCNARLLEYTGFSASEVMGAGWTNLLHPDDVEHTAREWLECIATGKQYVVEVRTFHAADGTYRWCTTSALPLLDAQDRIVKWYGTVVDMHDRKRADEELRRSELRLREVQDELAHVTRVTTMGELAASIAHEINQPIAGVVINANTSLRWLSRVKEESVNLSEARETIERIVRDGIRAGEIIARIRALFKKTEPAKERLNLNEAIQEIIILARNEIEKQKVVLRWELSANLPAVLGDRVQLQQVLLNLILNAVDAMSEIREDSRELLISTRSLDKSEVVVTVKDSGKGLPLDNAEAIFTAFHTTKANGLGMGLPISRTIIASHSGRLWFTANDGPGVSFHFTLPTAS
jgi:PAS domain S-box-containing protein